MNCISIRLIVVTASCFVLSAGAEDLGHKAPTYRVDPDAREQMKDVVRGKQRSGELDAFWKAYRDQAIASIKNPTPLGIKSDYRQHKETKAIRFVLPSDYRDERGVVVASRGTVVEPLKLKPLTTGLAFIDGRDPKQVEYAVARGRLAPLKIVLTAGSAFDLRVKYQNAPWYSGRGVPFYFDQRRMIISSLQSLYGVEVASVPVVLTQAGTGLSLSFGMEAVQ